MNDQRCILVVGLEGSGTSCTAGVLHQLGINMGENIGGPTRSNPRGIFEDAEYKAAHGKPQEKLDGWAKHRVEADHEIWGVKFPWIYLMWRQTVMALVNNLPEIDIRMIYVKRRIPAIAYSNYYKRLPADPDFQRIFESAHSGTAKIEAMVLQMGRPTLEAEYEMLVMRPVEWVAKIAKFCFDGKKYPRLGVINRAIVHIDPELKHW